MDIQSYFFQKEINKAVYSYKARIKPLRLPYFTSDYLDALWSFGDIKKGLVGCSTAYIPRTKNSKYDYFIRNLDWPSLGNFANHLIQVTLPTNHNDEIKPKYIVLWTLNFGPSITGTNGKLTLALNEAERSKTMRTNPYGVNPQFINVINILKNCSTIKDVQNYLAQNPPASPHILIAMASDGGGIFEMLPSSSPRKKLNHKELEDCVLYRFRGLSETENDHSSFYHATNHFQDKRWKLYRRLRSGILLNETL